MFENSNIRKSCELLRETDFILVAAGAGLSVDAGIDYTETLAFALRFPALAKVPQLRWSGFHERARG